MNTPIYVTQPVADYAEEQAARLTELGCSPEYVAKEKADILAHGVQVKNAYESNAIQSGRA